jgi:hypothetical protein
MKKIFFCVVAAAFINVSAQAQISLPKIDGKTAASTLANFIKPPAIGDVTQTTGNIVSDLTGKLALSAVQKPALTSAISSFLQKKNSILSLANTNPAQYLSKFNPLQSDLFSKVKGIVGAAKFASLLKLKPAGTGAGNVLSNLFF